VKKRKQQNQKVKEIDFFYNNNDYRKKCLFDIQGFTVSF